MATSVFGLSERDVMSVLCLYLPIEALGRFSQVCKLWRELLSSNKIWKAVYRSRHYCEPARFKHLNTKNWGLAFRKEWLRDRVLNIWHTIINICASFPDTMHRTTREIGVFMAKEDCTISDMEACMRSEYNGTTSMIQREFKKKSIGPLGVIIIAFRGWDSSVHTYFPTYRIGKCNYFYRQSHYSSNAESYRHYLKPLVKSIIHCNHFYSLDDTWVDLKMAEALEGWFVIRTLQILLSESMKEKLKKYHVRFMVISDTLLFNRDILSDIELKTGTDIFCGSDIRVFESDTPLGVQLLKEYDGLALVMKSNDQV